MIFNKELKFKVYLADKAGKAIKITLVLYKLTEAHIRRKKEKTVLNIGDGR